MTKARAVLRRTPTVRPLESAAAPTHRRANLVIEVDPSGGLTTGAKVHLTVDSTRLHIFDHHGHRIDRITR